MIDRLSLRLGEGGSCHNDGKHDTNPFVNTLLVKFMAESAAMPSGEITWPKNVTDYLHSTHLAGCSLSPACRRRSNTCCRLVRWCEKDFPRMIMSSRYTRLLDHCNPDSTVSISLWNVAGALLLLHLFYQTLQYSAVNDDRT